MCVVVVVVVVVVVRNPTVFRRVLRGFSWWTKRDSHFSGFSRGLVLLTFIVAEVACVIGSEGPSILTAGLVWKTSDCTGDVTTNSLAASSGVRHTYE